ncbi:hypothetical protein LCGC14_3004290, partial [marine sediment metagenome]
KIMMWLTPTEFQKIVAAERGKKFDSPPPPRAIRKTLPVVVRAPEDGEGPIDFILSTVSEDRDGDTIKVNGWDLKHYRKNPVVLFVHDNHSLPVGRSIKIGKTKESLDSSTEFTPKDLYPFGHTVGQMYRRGFLHAVSVGFRATDWKDREEPKVAEMTEEELKGFWGPIDFLKQELLEYSAVPVPANPEALIQARSAGIDMRPWRDWAEKMLSGKDEIWIPKSYIENAHQALKTANIVDMGGNAFVGDRQRANNKQKNWFAGIHIIAPETELTLVTDDHVEEEKETKTVRRCRAEDRDPDRPADEQVWCLIADDGSVLGRHATRGEAEDQEAAIEANRSVDPGLFVSLPEGIPQVQAKVTVEGEV